MKKKPISLKSLKLNKEAIYALQQKNVLTGGGSNNQLCFPPDDGGTVVNSNKCASRDLALCPRDSDLCYSGKIYISQCCV